MPPAVDWEVITDDEVTAEFNSSFPSAVAEGINAAGGGLSISADGLSMDSTPTAATEVQFVVLVNATDESASDLSGGLAAALSDPTAVAAELNAAGGEISADGLQAAVLDPNNCTAGTTVKHSDRTLGAPCSGQGGDVCEYTCDTGYGPHGSHVCMSHGSFVGGRCSPDGFLPYICGMDADGLGGVIRDIPTVDAGAANVISARSVRRRYSETGPTVRGTECAPLGRAP